MTSATIFPDTTILIQYQSLDRIDWPAVLGVDSAKVVLATAMLQEIEDIREQDISPTLAKRADAALTAVDTLLNIASESPEHLKVIKATSPDIDFSVESLDPNSIADLLVATVIDYQRKQALEYVVLFTDDPETRVKARKAGVEVAALPKNYLVDNQGKPAAPAPAPPTQERSSPLLAGKIAKTPSTQRLARPTPLFKNSLIPESARPAEASAPESEDAVLAEHTEETPATEDISRKTKLFEVIDPLEEATKSPVIAVEKNHPEPEEIQVPEVVQQETPPPPFIDIKQEPARPDPGYVEFITSPPQPASAKADTAGQNRHPKTGEPIKGTVTSRLLPPEAPDTAAVQKIFSGLPSQTSSVHARTSTNGKKTPTAPPATLTPEPEEKPELRLAFEEDESRSTLIIHHPEYPTIDEVTERIADLRRQYPKLALLGPSGGDGIDNSQYATGEDNEAFYQRKNNRIKRYNASLDGFYASWEKYLSEMAEFENQRRRSAQLNLMLINELPDALKSLYIAIHFPSNMRVYSEDTLPDKPVGPTPPEEPNLEALFDTIRLPRVPVPGEIYVPDTSDIKMRSRNLAPVEVRWNKGWDVIYSIREIKKGEHIPFNPLYIVFNSFEHATSFRIHFRITVASASYEEKGNLEMLVRKEI